MELPAKAFENIAVEFANKGLADMSYVSHMEGEFAQKHFPQ